MRNKSIDYFRKSVKGKYANVCCFCKRGWIDCCLQRVSKRQCFQIFFLIVVLYTLISFVFVLPTMEEEVVKDKFFSKQFNREYDSIIYSEKGYNPKNVEYLCEEGLVYVTDKRVFEQHADVVVLQDFRPPNVYNSDPCLQIEWYEGFKNGKKFVLESLEPPHCRELDMKDIDFVTTYRRDCPIMSYQHSYAWLYDREEMLELMKQEVDFSQKDDELPVFWLGSNCYSRSGREYYLMDLMRHINVASYGTCLNNMGSEKFMNRNEYKIIPKELVDRHYFYMAIENSNCDDYVTEKYWKTLVAGLVPILDGPVDYSDFLPSQKVIRLDDFDSPKELAEHLKYLVNNRTAYLEYMPWKTDSNFEFNQGFLDILRTKGESEMHKDRICEMNKWLKEGKKLPDSCIQDTTCKHKKWVPWYPKKLFRDIEYAIYYYNYTNLMHKIFSYASVF
eukprot:TRINITY_DN5339_c0_g1_i1.p1 TRINITY_DN5339_c0_g1~~TRINITY_DN5339_c0_g1_i1.p1  ORF type:complete len:446 (-),score=75.69 TRINITY_DN5339_c0_g1_i1:3-1340(-)